MADNEDEYEAGDLVGKGSIADKIIKQPAKYKQSRLDQIMAEGNMTTTRGDNPPQYGRSNQNMDEEGNQDTLK